MRSIFVQDISDSSFSWSFALGSGRKNLGTRFQGFLLVTWHSILSQAKFHSMQLCDTNIGHWQQWNIITKETKLVHRYTTASGELPSTQFPY